MGFDFVKVGNSDHISLGGEMLEIPPKLTTEFHFKLTT